MEQVARGHLTLLHYCFFRHTPALSTHLPRLPYMPPTLTSPVFVPPTITHLVPEHVVAQPWGVHVLPLQDLAEAREVHLVVLAQAVDHRRPLVFHEGRAQGVEVDEQLVVHRHSPRVLVLPSDVPRVPREVFVLEAEEADVDDDVRQRLHRLEPQIPVRERICHALVRLRQAVSDDLAVDAPGVGLLKLSVRDDGDRYDPELGLHRGHELYTHA